MKWIEYEINGVRHARPVATWHDYVIPFVGSFLVALFIFVGIPLAWLFI